MAGDAGITYQEVIARTARSRTTYGIFINIEKNEYNKGERKII